MLLIKNPALSWIFYGSKTFFYIELFCNISFKIRKLLPPPPHIQKQLSGDKMKNKISIAIGLIISMALFSQSSFAENRFNNFYFGGNLNILSFETDNALGDVELDFVSIGGLIGVEVHPNISVEGRLGFGIIGDDYSIADFDIEHHFNLLAKGALPLKGATLYGLVGYSEVEISGSASGYSLSEDESGLSIGAGIELPVSTGGIVGIEYLNMVDDSDFNLGGIILQYRGPL